MIELHHQSKVFYLQETGLVNCLIDAENTRYCIFNNFLSECKDLVYLDEAHVIELHHQSKVFYLQETGPINCLINTENTRYCISIKWSLMIGIGHRGRFYSMDSVKMCL